MSASLPPWIRRGTVLGGLFAAAWLALPLPAAWWLWCLPAPWILAIGHAANAWGPAVMAGAGTACFAADRGPHARRWTLSVGLLVGAGVAVLVHARPGPAPSALLGPFAGSGPHP